jgi:uncharacterized protein YcaQ
MSLPASPLILSTPEKLSTDQARKLVLHSQQLPSISRKGTALSATQAALEHLGYIQIDTISVVERAHHHTLWNRNPRYQNSHVDQLFADKTAFEYWSHAAAYLPMRDFRYSLPRKQAIKSGEPSHWFARDEKLERFVHDRIRAEGSLMAKDFAHSGQKTGEWQSKPAKKALENLFMQGDLMIPRRQNFHKVYDLTERVLREGIDTTMPTEKEHARFMIRRFLEANGLAQARDFSYLIRDIKPAILGSLEQMIQIGEVIRIQVGELCYFALPDSLGILNKSRSRSKLNILSPFDNLLIQRQRMRDLFDFDYQIECYVTAAKRKFGYFSLPILWDGRFVARMDCKAERKTKTLQIRSLHLEPSLQKFDEFRDALSPALEEFMRFNGCEKLDNPTNNQTPPIARV